MQEDRRSLDDDDGCRVLVGFGMTGTIARPARILILTHKTQPQQS